METKAEDRAAECPAVVARAIPSGDDDASRCASGIGHLLAEWLALCDAFNAAEPVPFALRRELDDLEWRIIETPAANMAELLLKGRVAKSWFDDRRAPAYFAGEKLAADAARLLNSWGSAMLDCSER